jgi:hypothetical protein
VPAVAASICEADTAVVATTIISGKHEEATLPSQPLPLHVARGSGGCSPDHEVTNSVTDNSVAVAASQLPVDKFPREPGLMVPTGRLMLYQVIAEPYSQWLLTRSCDPWRPPPSTTVVNAKG